MWREKAEQEYKEQQLKLKQKKIDDYERMCKVREESNSLIQVRRDQRRMEALEDVEMTKKAIRVLEVADERREKELLKIAAKGD